MLNLPPGPRGKRDQPIKTIRPSSKYVWSFQPQFLSELQCLCVHPIYSLCSRGAAAGAAGGEEVALHLMLERREAELREAMKLRHSLTTLLHALRVDMEQVSRTPRVLLNQELGYLELPLENVHQSESKELEKLFAVTKQRPKIWRFYLCLHKVSRQ